MEDYRQELAKASEETKLADHLIYSTYPLIREKRLLIKILDVLSNAALSLVKAILFREYAYKRITLSENERENRAIFASCSGRYGISPDQVKLLTDLLQAKSERENSSVELVKNDRLILLNDALKTKTVSVENMKVWLWTLKAALKKAENVFLTSA